MKSSNSIKVIYYSSIVDAAGGRLQRVIEMLFTREQLEIFRTIEALNNRLHQPLTEPLIFVIFIDSPEELSEMTTLHEALQDRRIILVLPDSNPDSVAKGHSLRPRFLTYADSDFVEVLGVLGKMAGTYTQDGHPNKKHHANVVAR